MVMVSSMTWLSNLTNRVSHHKRSGRHCSKQEQRPTLGILAFEAARTMSRIVSLYKSLSEDQIADLRKNVMKSQGVAYLNSTDEGFLLRLACAERMEDLDRSAISVARFGKKCSDPGLSQFEFAYADLKLGFIDVTKIDLGSKDIAKSIEKMEKFISATSGLYGALEGLSEMEALEKKTKRWKDHSGPISVQKSKNEFSEHNLLLQRQHVQHLEQVSLWNQPFDKIVGFMARTVCIVFARICVIFGPYISVLPTATPVSSRHVRFSSLQFQPPVSEEPVKQVITSRSGPLQTKHGGSVRFWSKDTKPLPGENIGFRIGIKDNKDFGFGWIEKTTRLSQQAPATTVGGSGLALRYASVIISLEKYLECPCSLTDCGREDLYQMLPESLKMWVTSKLKKLYRNQNTSESGWWWEDEALAQSWRDGLNVIMGWLAPMGHDTVTWMNERSFEKYNLDAKPTVLLLQTLFFADREKTEAAIVEVLVGLSFICRYEINRPGEGSGGARIPSRR